MSKFQVFSIILFVMLFSSFLTNAVKNDLKKRSLAQGQRCTNEVDDTLCDTQICRIKGEDTYKCQVSDERDVGDVCVIDEACKSNSICDDEYGTCLAIPTPKQ
ncbi:hypothetical protein C2G38_2066789 [Gigaspora rosea]|uniref:Dickkopf N-terminal cysteine-rich domain-containing protein n=1 Tax=Gigaspora rosea TaxID=44941 RepID=A0A397VVE2_9GLOM|nr:hypothetical protein C2G38_2066789 [Gigaspora rosea]